MLKNSALKKRGILLFTRPSLKCLARNGNRVEQSAKAQPFVGTAVEAETGARLFDSVNTIIDTKMVGQAGHRVAIRTESHTWDRRLADVLPDNAESTNLLMKPPEYPVCSVEPSLAKPGKAATVKVFDLMPKETARVSLRHLQLAESTIGDKGIATMIFRIPETAPSGV